MPRFIRRILPLLLISMFAASAIPAVASASSDLTVDQAPAYLLAQINTARSNLGLVPVLLDTRVQSVSQARSADMATRHYFGHLTDAQLGKMFDDRTISWNSIGEILAKNDYPTLRDSADSAMTGWRGSPSHWNIITSSSFNYAAVGVAWEASTSSWIWTVEFLRGPDRTGAKASFTGSTVSTSSVGHAVRLTWTGKDVKLSALTAGLKDFQLRESRDGATWTSLLAHSTTKAKTVSVARGHTAKFRLRARDKNGNYGSWVTSSTFSG